METLVLSTLLTQAGAVIMTQKHLFPKELVAVVEVVKHYLPILI